MKMYFYLLIIMLFASEVLAQNQTLFTLLEASQTGVNFNNKIVDTKENNILLYSNYYGGAGVAIGDLDNDGLQDLYFAGNLVSDKIYKNLGGLKFEDLSSSAGIVHNGSWSSSVILGDVNNDNLLDIYVTCELYDDQPELRTNKLYINQGDFKFKESASEYGLDDSERSRNATFIDFDKDGYLDLFVLNQPPNPGNYSRFSGQDLLKYEWSPRLYKNTGNGRFIDISLAAGVAKPCYPNSVIAADLNNDGWQDLYVANDYEAPDFLYINNQDGTFTNTIDESMKHISYYAMGVDAADINNDGLLDLMTLDMVAEDNFRLKRNMSGMEPKLFWKLVSQGAHYQYMYNALHLNQGNNHFSDIAQMAGVSSTDWSWSNVMADFDNDGWKDIYVTNGLLRDIRNTDMSKKFPLFVQETIDAFIQKHPNAGTVEILDILDLEKGLAMHPSVPLKNYAYKNEGNLDFKKANSDWGLNETSFSNGCAYGDLDNDGDLDLVVNNINDPAFIYQNNASNDINSHYLRVVLKNPNNLVVQGSKIKINCNGELQFSELSNARGMYSMSENIIHFGLGKHTIVDTLEVIWPDQKKSILTQVKADQTITINNQRLISQKEKQKQQATFKATEGSELGINWTHSENDFDDFSRQILLPHEMSHQGPACAVGDVNADGLDDIYLGGANGQSGQLYLQNANEKFVIASQSWITDAIYEDIDARFFDADLDGDLDLYVVSGGNAFPPRHKNYLDRFYLNDGKGNFNKTTEQIPRLLESGSCVRPFDFDNDGDLDLFIGGRHQPWDYPSPSISRLLENKNGRYTDVTKTKGKAFINMGMVTDALPTDFNQDGKIDLIIVGEWMPIGFYENQDGSFLNVSANISKDGQKVNTSGWWNCIKTLDLNKDGIPDYLIGNLGKNYKYKATQAEPFSVHYADFDQNGKKDIVLSYYNFGEQFPLRGRSCSAQQIPELEQAFPSYDIFAGSKLSQVYAPAALGEALHYDAHLFENVVLYGQGNLSFKLEPLPNEAQISSINDFEILTEDNAKETQILIAGNFFQAEVETPRNDGSVGMVLDASGPEIEAIHPRESGIYIPSDVRHLQAITIGNKAYILVISNNSSLELISKSY